MSEPANPIELPAQVIVNAVYVGVVEDGKLITDQFVNATLQDAMVMTIAIDSEYPPWQAYLEGGGDIGPYVPVAPPISPGPELLQLYPETMPVNSDVFEITCYGENFSWGDVVIFNDAEMPSVFLDYRQIVATIPPQPTPGDYAVVVATLGPNLSNHRSDPLYFTVTDEPPEAA